MPTPERSQVKEAILQRLSEELDLWLDKAPTLSSGHAYEAEFITVSRRMSKIVLEESVGEAPRSRNAKKKS